MSFLFQELLFRPLFNILVALYNVIPGRDFGVAIIVLTILIRLLFVPLSRKALLSQREMAVLQPKIQELQKKYKDKREELGKATMELYKEHKVNPFSGCVPILIQLPVILALYRVFISGLDPEKLDLLYPFVANPGHINNIAFGFLDLAESLWPLAIIAGVAQAVQLWMANKNQHQDAKTMANNPALQMTRQMLYFFPILIIFISWSLPAGLVLYWIVTTLFSIGEQLTIRRNPAH